MSKELKDLKKSKELITMLLLEEDPSSAKGATAVNLKIVPFFSSFHSDCL